MLSRFKRSEINEYMKTIRELRNEDLIVKDVHSSHKSNVYRCEKKPEKKFKLVLVLCSLGPLHKARLPGLISSWVHISNFNSVSEMKKGCEEFLAQISRTKPWRNTKI